MIRLELTGAGPVFRYGRLVLPSGAAVSVAMVPDDWDALERVLKATGAASEAFRREMEDGWGATNVSRSWSMASGTSADFNPDVAPPARDVVWSAAEELASWDEDDRRAERRADV